MQPVSDNRLQQPIPPARQKISGRGTTSPASAKMPMARTGSVFPEDVVNLSTDRPANPDAAAGKRPSQPVTPSERKALSSSFSVYA